MTDKKTLAEAVEATRQPTGKGYTMSVVQSGQLGLFALKIDGPDIQVTLYGTLPDLAQLTNQAQVDIARQGDLAHIWWHPEVEA